MKKRGDLPDWDYTVGELETPELIDLERQNRELSRRLFGGEALSDEDSEMLAYILDSGFYGTMVYSEQK